MNPRRRRITAAFLAGVLLGVIVGSLCQRHAFRKWLRGPDTERILKKLTRELSLDARQQGEVRAVLESRKAKFDALHKETKDKFAALRAEAKVEIGKLLTPEQRRKYDDMMARFEAHHKRDFAP